jgi:hypothetical protein
MKRKAQRPIDVKDMMWSHIGKDELDKAAETVWESMRPVIYDHRDFPDFARPYQLFESEHQAHAQRAVLAILGTTVPNLLRERARDYPETGDILIELADELEESHG